MVMRAENYWVNWTDAPMQFFMDGPVRYTVSAFDTIFMLPREITRSIPDGLIPSIHALVYLYRAGFPTKTNDEHRRLIGAFVSAGLLEKGSVPGNVTPTQDGMAVLHHAGVV